MKARIRDRVRFRVRVRVRVRPESCSEGQCQRRIYGSDYTWGQGST